MRASRHRIEMRLLQQDRAEVVRPACCSSKHSGEHSEAVWPSEDLLDVLSRTLGPRANHQFEVESRHRVEQRTQASIRR